MDDGSAIGGGLRLGYFRSPVFSIEADASLASADDGNLSHLPIHLRALLNLPFSESLSLYVGTGPMIDRYGEAASLTNIGIGTAAGARFGIGPRVAVRVDGTWDWVVAPEEPLPTYGNLGLQAGLSFFLGSTGGIDPSGDGDGDGVLNRADACPGTPPNSEVDATGCPRRSDSDADGVIDINDICPGTAAGLRVDANGCTGRESD